MIEDVCTWERKPALAVDIQKVFSKDILEVPWLVECKEHLRQNPEQSYCISSFVGGNSTLVVMKVKRKKSEGLLTLINPTLLSTTGLVMSEEIQHGVEGVYLVPRHPKIEVMFLGLPHGLANRQVLIGKSALMFQQAYHALSGIFICDIGLRIDNYEEYQKADDIGKNEIVENYMKILKETGEEAVAEDENLSKYVEATAFLATKIDNNITMEGALDAARNAKAQNNNAAVRQTADTP